ncbi:hypothetical protein [Streptosporangium longisporum]|uniref:hypothetical protein n=1 Tax=Streptosporangium longisporum TaxID=46187 RepID=UPI0031E94995
MYRLLAEPVTDASGQAGGPLTRCASTPARPSPWRPTGQRGDVQETARCCHLHRTSLYYRLTGSSSWPTATSRTDPQVRTPSRAEARRWNAVYGGTNRAQLSRWSQLISEIMTVLVVFALIPLSLVLVSLVGSPRSARWP